MREKLLKRNMTRKEFLIFSGAAALSLVGVTRIMSDLKGWAAGAFGIEAEDGAVTGPAAKLAVSGASGGQAVRFGAGQFVAFAPGTVKPLGYADEAAGAGARNVGPRLANLTRHDGDYTLAPGAKVSGLEIFGRLIGRGDANTVVSDCIIHGADTPATANSAAALGTSYNFGGATIEWCRIDLTGNEGGFTDTIAGGNYTLQYSELTGGVDGVGANTIGNATIQCCRIWNGYYTSWWNDGTNSVRTAAYTDADGIVHNPPFPAQSSGDTHSDGMQIQQYGGWVIRGNYIGGTRTPTVVPDNLDPTIKADNDLIKQFNAGSEFVYSAVMLTPLGQGTDGVVHAVGALIENNWFHGGATRLNVGWKAEDPLSGVTIRNNRFIRSNYGYYIYKHGSTAANFSNNVYDDTGAAVPLVDWPNT